ncbi:kinase-like domain-containing protein [Aspergillus heterothallicus]
MSKLLLQRQSYRLSSVHTSVQRRSGLLIRQNRRSRHFTTTATNPTGADHDFSDCILYEPIEGVESLEKYQAGGNHPVQVGDILHRRYYIVHELGYGSYSTIWLARDKNSNKYVALKISTAGSNPGELNILSALSCPRDALLVNAAVQNMVPSISDTFTIKGPNGTHACYVMPPARVSLSQAKDGSWIRLFRLDGIVHGDLHLANVLLKLAPTFDDISIDQLYETYGAPEPEPVVLLDSNKPLPAGVPSHVIPPIWLGEASENITLPEAQILLSDFGEAFAYLEERRYESRTPLVTRPPEARFEPHKPLAFSSDIWSLGCGVWSIVAQRPLFEVFFASEALITRE